MQKLLDGALHFKRTRADEFLCLKNRANEAKQRNQANEFQQVAQTMRCFVLPPQPLDNLVHRS